jgi:hypothetical protein
MHLVLTWMLSVVSVVAPKPDHPVGRLWDLIHSSRRVQVEFCEMFTPEMLSTESNLIRKVLSDLEGCLSTGCVVDVQSLPAYNRYEVICKEVKGAFHLYSVDINCSGVDFLVKNYPLCYASARYNSACVPELGLTMAGWFVDIDEECTATANHTGVIDYYIAPRPAMRPVKRPVMRPLRRPVMHPLKGQAMRPVMSSSKSTRK